MSTRFEINVKNGKYIVYDEYWDTVDYVKPSDANTPKAVAVKMVENLVKNGDKHTWFAVGISGHEHIFEIPTEIYPIPGRNLRYTR